MTRYRVSPLKRLWFPISLALGSVVAVGIGIVASGVFAESSPLGWPFLLLTLLLPAAYLALYLRMPTSLELTKDGKVQFRAPTRTLELGPEQISSVKVADYWPGWVRFRTTVGRIDIVGLPTGFSDFLSELGKLNPNVLVRWRLFF